MRAVLEFLSSLAGLLKLWLRQRYGERREADRTAVRDDAGGAGPCNRPSGCARWAGPTAATSPPPLTPGAVVTGEWSYTYRGETFTEPGEWVHLPAGEAGNLLLWIKGVEAEQ